MRRNFWKAGDEWFEAQMRDGYVLVVVTGADGDVWATTFTSETLPRRAETERLWKTQRPRFQRYDQYTGCYV